MGIAERRQREKEQRRNLILDSAERLFFNKGINETTMDEVAETAELSKGTLYLYFKNKDDIYAGVCLRGLTILKNLFRAAVESEQKGILKVRAIGQAYFQFTQKYSDYFKMMLHYDAEEPEEIDPETHAFKCHECSEEVMGIVSGAVQGGINDGTIKSDLDPLKTAYILWGQSSGVIQIVAKSGKHLKECHNINPDELISEMFNMIKYALEP